MGNSVRLLLLVVISLVLTSLLGSSPASAGGLCSSLILTCEDGRSYPFCPIAVSEEGEIATGYLTLSPRHGLHMRLVPMGAGYRYIGNGVWFEGIRSSAVLYFGESRAIACTVSNE
jgi:hypothetical protein